MITLSVAEAAAVLDVPVAGPASRAEVLDLVVDSRAARAGSLFFALPGERVDGHDYVTRVFDQGAVAAVTEREVAEAQGPCLVVPDAVLALGLLGRHVVDRAKAGGLQVVAITGSQGKTSTKDLLAQVLEDAGPTVAPYGNLNNEIGVPLTASRVEAGTRFLVVEMGARGVGHIAYLCGLTPPDVAVVLNVGQAHVGEFGSQQAIARAKGELVEALAAGGTAVLNADDPLVTAMAGRTAAPTLAFSVQGEPTTQRAVWASDVTSDDLGRCRFVLHAKDGHDRDRAEVGLRLSGRHHVSNAVAAAAAATAMGLDLGPVADALCGAELRSRSRMELHERSDDVVVVNDAYNANPDSMRAAIDTVVQIGRARRVRHPGARTWALLGDMLELGDTAADEHAAIGRHLGRAGVDRLVVVGEFAGAVAAAAVSAGMPPGQAVVATSKSEVAQIVLPGLRPGDTVLIKASRGLALDTVAEEIWMASPPSRSVTDQPQSEDPA